MNGRKMELPLYVLTVLLRIIGVVLSVLSLASLALTFTNSWPSVIEQFPSYFRHGEVKPAVLQLGNFAEFTVIGAAGFWISKKLLGQLRTRKLPIADFWIKRISGLLLKLIAFLKHNHRFLGWITVLLASGHGAYFLIFPDKKVKYFYTGLGALIGLVIVAAVGIMFDYWMKKKKRVKAGRRYHFAAAVLFGILFLIHLYV
jgi:hypothetical protein